jgi:5-methylcytosine-specific restriction enzyme A
MPYKPKRPCNHPGCPELTDNTYCKKHKKAKESNYNKYGRDPEAKKLYGYRWQKASKRFLAANPLCLECKKKGKLKASKVTDHIVPHKGNKELFWDINNWQPLCVSCHNRKTAKEDGGFGNKSGG